MSPDPPRPPSVDRLARRLADTGLPHPVLVDVARRAIAEQNVDGVEELARRRARQLLVPVVNATGVLLHTNLGRAPWPATWSGRPVNIEFDLASGARGHRDEGAAALLALACGAEDATVTNNGAAAVLLALAAMADGGSVAVSRGELVEIGGGFRIPDVMRQSGATLTEVGTTNRTRLADFAAVVDSVEATMWVHRSNFEVTGFVESTTVGELATLDVPTIADLGSGLLDSTCPWLADGPPPWLRDEPGVRQLLEDGADLVIFSGDKLLGGPQAGCIVGTAEAVDRCRRHPLARALRSGTHVLTALQEVALAYLRRDGAAIPFWRMATTPVDELRPRAERVTAAATGTIVDSEAVTGGGTLPGRTIDSVAVALDGDVTGDLLAHDPPVVGRVVDGRTLLDLRTVDVGDDDVLVSAIAGLSP